MKNGYAPDAAGFHIFEKNFGPVLTTADTAGERITIEGRVDGFLLLTIVRMVIATRGVGLPDLQQHIADRRPGAVDNPAFRGWGRTCSDFTSGIWRFETIKPGPVVGRDGRLMAPHVNLWVVARGINIGLNTRMYFADEHEANASDPVLNLIEWEVRRKTLIAEREVRGTEVVYRFDIHLQGENETVFFDI